MASLVLERDDQYLADSTSATRWNSRKYNKIMEITRSRMWMAKIREVQDLDDHSGLQTLSARA
jgi:hypothetical protein